MPTARRLWPLAGAELTLDRAMVAEDATGTVTLPVPVFLIEHDHGLVLFDTGIAPAAWEDARGVYGSLLDVFELHCEPQHRLDVQLGRAGYTPDDVSHVVLSHTHFDHTGGVGMFDQARVYLSEEDLQLLLQADIEDAGVFRRGDLEGMPSDALHLLSSDHDLFGDGSIRLLRTPGHTPGQLSLLVRLPGGVFLLSGDAAHLRDNLERGVPCPVDMDQDIARRSLERISHLRRSLGARVWIPHDPEDWARLGSTATGYC